MSHDFQSPSRVSFNVPLPTRPPELFRADLISAMKIPDTHQLEPNSYIEIKESWRTEWEAGVQVCANGLPMISFKHGVRTIGESSSSSSNNNTTITSKENCNDFIMPSVYMSDDSASREVDSLNNTFYELDELDIAWLETVNKTRKYRVLTGHSDLSESILQKAITTLERKCYQNMLQAIKTEETLRIEFDESVVCDICRDPEREENNEMIFCDSCNVCVHQACYGVLAIPDGSWLCKPCGVHCLSPACVLCPNRSGAMKQIKPSPGWAHISCTLWIPEVKLGNVERMEPVTNIEAIPASRWNLICSVCRKKEGACIQCSYPTCVLAYHVTCGFRDGLEMRTRLANNGVVHESYCAKHTTLRKTPTKNPSTNVGVTAINKTVTGPSGRGGGSPGCNQLRNLLDNFHDYVTPQDLCNSNDQSSQLSSLIYNYWMLKRKSCFNRPLIPELYIDFSSQRLPNQMVYEMTIPEDEDFLNIVHARHNLEAARNLVYMVQRRERCKRQMIIVNEDITRLELRLLEEETLKGNKQPLCLKRLGVMATDDVPKRQTENGNDNNNYNSSSGSETDNTRVLRKKRNNHLVGDNSEDNCSPLSPKKSRQLSEGYAVNSIITLHASNGQLSKGDNTVSFKQHC